MTDRAIESARRSRQEWEQEADEEARWAREWAICANASNPEDIVDKRVLKLASRYFDTHVHSHPDAIAAEVAEALEAMVTAAQRLIVAPLDGRRFSIDSRARYRGKVEPNGDLVWQLTYRRPLPATPEEDLAILLENAHSVFPFRRCVKCQTIFARNGRQEYCDTACSRAMELERRKNDGAYKKRQRERMRRRRAEARSASTRKSQ